MSHKKEPARKLPDSGSEPQWVISVYKADGSEELQSLELEKRRLEVARLRAPDSTKKDHRHNKWDSYTDARRRRMIVKSNPSLDVESLCQAFDAAQIGLPPGWEDKYKITTWVEANANQKTHRSVARIISTDRNQN